MGIRKKKPMIVYKALKGGVSPYQGYTWPLPSGDKPGEWVEISPSAKPALCAMGPHGYLTRQRAEAAGDQVFEMELEGDVVQDRDKAAGRRGRLLRQLSGVRSATLGELADAVTRTAAPTLLAAAAAGLGVTQASIKKAIPADLYVVNDADTLVPLATTFLSTSRVQGDVLVRRVAALAKMPLTLEVVRA